MTAPPWMNKTKPVDNVQETAKTPPVGSGEPKEEASKGQGQGQSPPPLGTTSALAVPDKERQPASMGDGREGHPLILPPDVAEKYGDKDLILPDWWTSPYTAMPHDFPKGSGYGYVQSPYTSWWTRIYGVSPIADLPKYRYMYRNVPEIKAAIDKTVFLAVARGFDLKLPKDDAVQGGPAQGAGAPGPEENMGFPPKAPPFGQKGPENPALGEGGAQPEENEPEQEQAPGEPQEPAVSPEGAPALKPKPKPFAAAFDPAKQDPAAQDTPPEDHPLLQDKPDEGEGLPHPKGVPEGIAPKSPMDKFPEQDKALAVRAPGGLAIPKPKTKNQQIIEFLEEFLDGINWIDIQIQALTDMLVYGNAWVELAYDGQKALERNLDKKEAKDIKDYSTPAPEGYKPGPDNKVLEIKGEGKVWDMKLLDPLFMRVRRDSLGNVYGAIQWLAWPPVVFGNDKVVHVAYNRKSWAYENAYGTSILMSLIRVQDMIWQLESDMMAVSHINIAPALTIYGGTPEHAYSNTQMAGLIDDMENRGPASNIFLKGDCRAEALPLIAQLGGISQFFNYLKEQRIVLLGVPPDLMGIEMPGSYSKSAVSIAEFKARVRALQEIWANALHDFIFPRILRPVFGDDCPIPKCVFKSVFEEDRTQTSNRVREDYKLGLITKRVALQEAGYDLDPSDPDLDEFYKPPAPPPGLGGPEQFEDKDGNPAVPAGSGPDGEPVDKDGAPLKRKPPPPPFGGPPGAKPNPFAKTPGKSVAGQPPPGAGEDFGKPNLPYKAAEGASLAYLSKLAVVNGFGIYLVNAEYISKNIDARWDPAETGHIIGGHHWALSMLYIPTDEIWISNAVAMDARKYVMVHEVTEAPLMRDGMPYGEAHARAEGVEDQAKQLDKSVRDFNYGIGDMSDGDFQASEADHTEQGHPFGAYSEDQARDESGKWTSDGGGPSLVEETTLIHAPGEGGPPVTGPTGPTGPQGPTSAPEAEQAKEAKPMSRAEAVRRAREHWNQSHPREPVPVEPKEPPKEEQRDSHGRLPSTVDKKPNGDFMGKHVSNLSDHTMAIEDKYKSVPVTKFTTPDGATFNVKVSPKLAKLDPGQVEAFQKSLKDMPEGMASAFGDRTVILHDYNDRPIEGTKANPKITMGLFNTETRTLHIYGPLSTDPGVLSHEVGHAEMHRMEDEIVKEVDAKLSPEDREGADNLFKEAMENRENKLKELESQRSNQIEMLTTKRDMARAYLPKYDEAIEKVKSGQDPAAQTDIQKKAAIEYYERIKADREKTIKNYDRSVRAVEKKFDVKKMVYQAALNPESARARSMLFIGKVGSIKVQSFSFSPTGAPPEDASPLHNAVYKFHEAVRNDPYNGPTAYARIHKSGPDHVSETYAEMSAVYGTENHRGVTRAKVEKENPGLVKAYRDLREEWRKRRG